MMISLAVLSGALVGFSLGLVGGGGSILATPLLLYVVGVSDPHIAIGTSAVAVSMNAYLNFLTYLRSGVVRWGAAIIFASVGSVGALGGSNSWQSVRCGPPDLFVWYTDDRGGSGYVAPAPS